MDNELLLLDRLEVIRSVNKKYDLEHNAYLSFSGGKDSTILHYLIDLALPNNNIPRVFINTGIEYLDIFKFVQEMAKQDNRFVIINNKMPIKDVLDKYGYPFKSKEHSMRVYQFNNNKNANYIKKYITGYDFNHNKKSSFICPKKLLYQFERRGKYNYSHLCCQKLKKDNAHLYEKDSNRHIVLTGMRSDEGGNRKRLGCIITDNNHKLLKFHPLIKVNDNWEDWFINNYNIKLCKLYYPPFNFKRTGCKGCVLSLDLQQQLDIMAQYLPQERKQCEIIWKPIYDEYRRINYRLSNDVNIYDLLL